MNGFVSDVSSGLGLELAADWTSLRVLNDEVMTVASCNDPKLLLASESPPSGLEQHCASMDVFSNAPFPHGRQDVFTSAPFPQHQGHATQAQDVFLQAPFGPRKDLSVRFQTHPVAHPPVWSQTRPPRCPEAAVLQQPIAAHRVVSSVGQQAAVGSVSVGPLHSWTVGLRAVMDPFLAAPFQPRGAQGKP